jgi:hypothetical protein
MTNCAFMCIGHADPGRFPENFIAPRYFIWGWEWARSCHFDGNCPWPWHSGRHNKMYQMTTDYRQFMDGQEAYMEIFVKINKIELVDSIDDLDIDRNIY